MDGGEHAASTPEIGIDIIRVDRIANVLRRHPERFELRVLTAAERSYVRGRPETMAGRWAAKEAVSKVLGLGVRGIGWQEIEVERLPTGQPSVRLHDRAAARASQLGIQHVALSISHEREYAIAIAYAVRTAGGRYLFPPQIGEDLDAAETALLARIERIKALRREELALLAEPVGKPQARAGSLNEFKRLAFQRLGVMPG